MHVHYDTRTQLQMSDIRKAVELYNNYIKDIPTNFLPPNYGIFSCANLFTRMGFEVIAVSDITTLTHYGFKVLVKDRGKREIVIKLYDDIVIIGFGDREKRAYLGQVTFNRSED